MSSLILTEDVARKLQQPDTDKLQPFVDTAHALIASAIGVDTLIERSVSELIIPEADTNLIQVAEGPIASLVADGPVSSVTSVVYGSDATEVTLTDLWIRKWTLKYRTTARFYAGYEYTVTYKAGYRRGNPAETITETTPARIKRALILTAAQLYKTPDSSITYEQIGDYSRKRESKTGSSAFLDEVKELIRDFKRPTL